MDHRFANFISETVVELLDNDIDIQFVNKSILEDGLSGYFDETNKKLKVATKKPFKYWFPTYVHEFCHFRQWKEKSHLWFDEDDLFFEWLKGVEIPKKKLERSRKIVILTEIDCEKRSYEMIKGHELPVDLKNHIKCSNAYLLSYCFFYMYRDWYSSSPYEDNEIVKKMPDYFLEDREYLSTKSKYEKVYKKLFE